MSDLQFTPQPTPNPNAIKFVASRPLHEGPPKTFYTADAARDDPVASRLFEVPGVTGVMVLADFCSVNQDGRHDWAELIPRIEAVLREAFT